MILLHLKTNQLSGCCRNVSKLDSNLGVVEMALGFANLFLKVNHDYDALIFIDKLFFNCFRQLVRHCIKIHFISEYLST